jgi:hypothetical protein
VDEALDALTKLQEEVHAHEQSGGLSLTRELDPGFTELAYRWAGGEPLEDVLATEDITPGRLRPGHQAADRPAAPDRPGRRGPGGADDGPGAVDACQRGVVAYSSLL